MENSFVFKSKISLDQFFKTVDNCRQAVCEARKLFGLNTITRDQYDTIEYVLGFVYMYCPEEFQNIARVTMDEAAMRRLIFETCIWSPEEDDD